MFFWILFLFLSVEAASITRIVPKSHLLKRSYSIIKKNNYNLVNDLRKNCQLHSVYSNVNYYLRDKEVIARLHNGPLPIYLLLDTDYFTDAVNRGKHVLCSLLLRKGQKVKLIDEEGNNLLVRIIENDMSYLIGILMETRTAETVAALHLKDSKTGHTPISKAVELGDRIAIHEIVSPRNIL